ncbi:Protein of unknown function [Halpernia humi]|uniref:DUF3467 domain-containing protein n=1 Tax=Halpernia humi TaxID=493375 RepID=A0A1H5YVF1_9FLAO|nr:DUF3467 domain-containing protein [Halpernia humi]SEG27722.1 Protein of unknown function [Halpernia humi]
MDNNQDQDQNNININLNEMVAQGVYCNLGLVNHSPSEFVVDFIQLMPGVQQANVRSRVILAPLHAKRVMAALQQNIANYEQQFGEIKEMEPFVVGQNNNVQA